MFDCKCKVVETKGVCDKRYELERPLTYKFTNLNTGLEYVFTFDHVLVGREYNLMTGEYFATTAYAVNGDEIVFELYTIICEEIAADAVMFFIGFDVEG